MATVTSDGAVARGIRTGIQTIVGLVVGLVVAIWAVPGVPGAVTTYLQHNVVTLVASGGVLSGLVGYIWNLMRKGVPNV